MFSWRALVAGLLVLGLGAGLVWVVAAQGDSSSPPPPTLVAATGSAVPTTVPATVTIPTSSPSTTTTTFAESATTAPPAAPPVVIGLRDALAAWGKFAVTGIMDDLADHFVVGGPQRRQLREEAAAIRENPPGPPAYEVTTSNVFAISVTTDDVVLRAEVIWARRGEETQMFTWDIQMRRVEGEWRLLTVEDVTETG